MDLFDKIEATLKRWSASCKRKKEDPPHGLNGDAWQDWFAITREDAKTEFLTLWPKFRFPADKGPIDAAVMLARATGLVCAMKSASALHQRK